MALVQRLINVSLNLANGNFGSGGNSANLTGLRISCQISKPGGKSPGTMEMAIYGLPLSTMNQLTIIGTGQNAIYRNTIIVEAGDAVSGMSLVFQGYISTAYMDARAMPDVPFRISATGTAYDAANPLPSTSIKGSGDVATMMQSLAKQMGYAFENNGITAKLASPYFSGSGWTQMLAIAKAAGIEAVIDNGTLAIWKPGQARQGASPVISPQTGMVGYPAFNQSGIVVATLYNPQVQYGGSIQVQSSLTPACGTWNIINIDYYLESMMPRGKWFSIITTTGVGR